MRRWYPDRIRDGIIVPSSLLLGAFLFEVSVHHSILLPELTNFDWKISIPRSIGSVGAEIPMLFGIQL